MDTDPMARPAAPKSTAVHASPDLTIGNLNTRRRRSRPVVRSAPRCLDRTLDRNAHLQS